MRVEFSIRDLKLRVVVNNTFTYIPVYSIPTFTTTSPVLSSYFRSSNEDILLILETDNDILLLMSVSIDKKFS